MDEVAQHSQLTTEAGIPAAGLGRWICKRAVLIACCERVIEMIEEPTAREHELPGLVSVRCIARAFEPSLVVADDLVQAKIRGYGIGVGVVEVEHGDSSVRRLDRS